MNSTTYSSKALCRYQRRISPSLRLITWLVLWAFLIAPFSTSVDVALAAAAAEIQQAVSGPGALAPKVQVNRTLPRLAFPADALATGGPKDEDLFRDRLGVPLLPTGPTTSSANDALSSALRAFERRPDPQDLSALAQFIEREITSPWRASLLLNLGNLYREAGRFSKALAAWEQAWDLTRLDRSLNGSIIADEALGNLAQLNAGLGRTEALASLLDQAAGRNVHGPATGKLAAARGVLAMMRETPREVARCGSLAVDRLRSFLNPLAGSASARVLEPASQAAGLSLAEVCTLANRLNLGLQAARRSPGAQLIVPAVLHWKLGHYSALLEGPDRGLQINDPALGAPLRMSTAALEEESSGYFLVPEGDLPTGWTPVPSEQAQAIFGKGDTPLSDTSRTKSYDKKVPCDENTPMASYSFHVMLASLSIHDTPVGYTPPRGPDIHFRVTYNQREANQDSTFAFSNLGHKWNFNWQAYIKDDPASPLSAVNYLLADGGMETFEGFDTNTSSFAVNKETGSRLVRLSSSSYELRMADGSKLLFNQTNNVTGTGRKVFLSRVADASGNFRTNVYDGYLRLAAVQDALGQVTALSYASTNPADTDLFYKISRVTDPFERYATFDYSFTNGAWCLTRITDILGITSEFAYGTNDFIGSLTTPYGTTAFDTFEGTLDSKPYRWIEATDPLGQKERVEYRSNAPGINVTDPPETVPAGLGFVNNYLVWRNSFYWDKRAMQLYPGDYTKARLYHFLHKGSVTSGVLESEKEPLENRVWYRYAGASDSFYEGTNGVPSLVARVLDDGTTQTNYFTYNELRRVTRETDPLGRTKLFVYATNAVDLLEVRQAVGAGTELLASFTYNDQHLPLTATDASGQTNWFAYNAFGQVLATTNALSEVVSFAYDTDGYLTNITGALPGAVTGFTYDDYGRVRTVTDSENYTVIFDYDAADRPTFVTYPDGTYQQTIYKWLDPILQKDRRGHWTATYYDALRRVSDVQDALSRVTHFQWCSCGSLESITDALSRTTAWARDVQGRPTAKIFPDSSRIDYVYEKAISRLKSVTDAKQQRTTYQYYLDNNLKSVVYAGSAVPTPSVAYTYEASYNRVATMTDGIGTTTYAYNPIGTPPSLGAGRLGSVDGPLANDTVEYFYDALGRVNMRAINGIAQAVVFDALGRVTTITNPLGTFSNVYVGATSRISTNFYPNGQTTTFTWYGNLGDHRLQEIRHIAGAAALSTFSYSYDADGQITTWTQQADAQTPKVWVTESDPVDQLLGVTVRSGTVLKEFAYSYDPVGNRLGQSIKTEVGSTPTSGSFNNLNQLTEVTGGGPVRFSGSINETGRVAVAGGRALMSNGTNFVSYANFPAGTNAVSLIAVDPSGNTGLTNYQVNVTNSGVAETLTYDLNGNQVSATTAVSTNTYEWDAADRLVRITQLSTTNPQPIISEFGYDGLGRRIRITEILGGAVQVNHRYQWCGTELCEERDGTGVSVTKRFFGLGEQQIILGPEPSNVNCYYTHDHVGSVREMTDSSGSLRARYQFDPYGQQTKVDGDLEAGFGFTGFFVHEPSGLHLALYRAYNSIVGRWLNRDPIGEADGINIYGYVDNNPINWIDPLGLTTYVSTAPFPGGNAAVLGPYIWMINDGRPDIIDGSMLNQAMWTDHVGAKDLSLDFWDTLNFARSLSRDLASSGKTVVCNAVKRIPAKKIREKWEAYYNKQWPKDPKKPERNQDAAHKRALADKGSDHPRNIKPQPHDAHMQEHMGNGDFSRWGKRSNQ